MEEGGELMSPTLIPVHSEIADHIHCVTSWSPAPAVMLSLPCWSESPKSGSQINTSTLKLTLIRYFVAAIRKVTNKASQAYLVSVIHSFSWFQPGSHTLS